MIRVPGTASSICDMPLSLISVTETITDLCKVPLSGPSDGRSFADLVRRPEVKTNYGPVFAEYNLGNQYAKYLIRDGHYKYSYWIHGIDELYDLRTGPEEMRNLANEPKHKPWDGYERNCFHGIDRPRDEATAGVDPWEHSRSGILNS